jgi:uncharacterized membrane protein
VKAFFAGIVTFGVLDFLYLGVLMRGFYRSELGPIARLSSDGSWEVLWAAAIPVYILLICGLLFFVLPRATGSAVDAFGWGALFGVVVYGVYDLTNLATLRHFPLRLAVVDMLWGAAVCGVVAVVMRWVRGS